MARQYRQFTAQDYLVGVSFGQNTEQAIAKASADLTGALRERLSMEFSVRGPKLQLAGSPVLKPERVAELASEPDGLKTAVTWSSASGQRHAAMVVAPREELAAAAREQITEWEGQALEFLTRSKGRRSQEPYASVMDLIATLLLRAQAEEQRALLAAISQSKPPAAKGPGMGELVAELERIWAGIQLLAARGNGLAVRADASDVGLVLAVDLKHSGRSLPFNTLPVKFELPPEGGERLITARVDPAGMAHARLSSVSAFTGRKLQVTARIDGKQVLTDAGIEAGDSRFAGLAKRLSQSQTTFELAVTDQQAGKIALVIAETRAGEFEHNSALAAGLERALTRAGFNVLPFEELDVDLPAEPTPESMAAIMEGKADFLVYGVANTTLDKQVAAGLVFAKAEGQLLTIRVPGGEVLAELKPSARAPGRDLDSAADRAGAAMIRETVKAISHALATAQATEKPSP